MTDRELMQQALEMIEDARNGSQRKPSEPVITALRERLAQPQMQPCAGRNCGSTNPNLHSAECFEDYEQATGMAQPEQEPVAFCNGMPAYEGSLSKAQRLTQDLEAPLTINGMPLYPKTEWVGLTDEEIEHIADSEWQEAFVRMIEAKLQEKNHG